MPADKSRTAIVRLYGGNCFSSRFVRDREGCGRGGEASDIFCAALSLTRLRRELPPGVSLGLSVLFVWCVPVGFVGVARQGQSLRLPSAATVSLRLGHTRALTTHCVVIHYPRAASLPLHKGGMSSGHPFIRA